MESQLIEIFLKLPAIGALLVTIFLLLKFVTVTMQANTKAVTEMVTLLRVILGNDKG